MEAETVAFGYPSRAFVFEQRVDFGYPRHAPSLTASDGLALLNRAWDFRSDLVRMAEVLFRNRGTAEFLRRATYSLIRNA
jgi:hypothetical protein